MARPVATLAATAKMAADASSMVLPAVRRAAGLVAGAGLPGHPEPVACRCAARFDAPEPVSRLSAVETLDLIAAAVASGHADRNSPWPSEWAGQDGVDELTRAALASGVTARALLDQGLVRGMKTIGDRFRDGLAFLPEVLMAARALNAGFEQLRPHFDSGAVELRGTIVFGTVAGDLHDIGKRIVGLFFAGSGWKVVDVGVDASLERFLAAIELHKPTAVGLSTLLTTTMPSMASIVAGIKQAHPKLKVMVGGAPVTAAFARTIGADAYAADPQAAVDFLG